MATTLTTLRAMEPADVDAAADAVLRGGWGDRRSFFRFAAGHPWCRPFVAVDAEGAVVGTGVGTVNGSVGWVGTIYVVPELRGAGVGRALTLAVIEALEAAGCRTLVLVATDLGRPLYERLGFTEQSHYRILEADGLASPMPEAPIRPFSVHDVETASRLDRAATGEDRGHLIAAFGPTYGSWSLDGQDGRLRAFLVRPPWGGGATIAENPFDVVRLLEHRLRIVGPSGRVRAGILDENRAGADLLHGLGWRDAWSAVRMIRGEPLDWRPDWIWGQFNFAIG